MLRKKKKLIFGLLIIICIALAIGWWGHEKRFPTADYEVEYLEKRTVVCKINNKGQIAGTYRNGLYLKDNDVITRCNPENITVTEITDFNDRGQVVGMFRNSEPAESMKKPFVWDEDTGFFKIPGLDQFSKYWDVKINNNGTVAGTALTAKKGKVETYLYLWDSNKGIRIIDCPFEHIGIADINDSGYVGGSADLNGVITGYIWQEPEGFSFAESGPKNIFAFALDNKSRLWYPCMSDDNRIISWNKNSGIEDHGIIPLDGFTITDINNKGEIVVTCVDIPVKILGFTFGKLQAESYFRDSKGQYFSLTNLFDQDKLFEYEDINDNGWIIGYELLFEFGPSRPVLLKPKSQSK